MHAIFATRSRAQGGARQYLLVMLLPTLLLAAIPQARGQEVVGPSEAGLPFKAVYTTTSTVIADPSSRCSELITDVKGFRAGDPARQVHYRSVVLPHPFARPPGVPRRIPRLHCGGRGHAPRPLPRSEGRGSGSGLLSPSLGEAHIVLDGNIQLPKR